MILENNQAVQIEEISPVKRKLTFDVTWEDVRKEMDAVLREIGKEAKIKGFRKGKVPKSILELYYKDRIEEETISNLIKRYYFQAIKEYQINAVNWPEIEQNGIEREKNFVFTAYVETMPEVEPKGYQNLKVEKPLYEVTEEDIARRLEEYRQMFAVMEEVNEDRGVKEGDYVTIDFSGTIDGVKRSELGEENFFLKVGEGRFIPGFEKELIGMKRGEVKEVLITFPEDYYVKEIAGREAEFTVHLKSIKERKVPELNEDFIANFEKYKSIDDLKEEIRQSLVREYEEASERGLMEAIEEELLAANEFEVPPSFVEREYNYQAAERQRMMARYGVGPYEFKEQEKKFAVEYRRRAERSVRLAIILDRIAQREGISVEEDEIEKRIDELAAKAREQEAVKKYYREEEAARGALKERILVEKVLNFVKEKAEIREVKREMYGEVKGK